MDKESLCLAVIGSSAGGLNALSELLAAFRNKPENISFIIAQHLSPDFKSHLAQLLARDSMLPVMQARDEQEIEAGVVYVTPPQKNISVRKGKISLKKSTTMHKPSIDELFYSAAAEYGKNSIGVILSGTGSDGMLGIIEIKKHGGLTIAQNPKYAGYDGMPVAAINSQRVDVVLQTMEMPAVIEHYATYGQLNGNLKQAKKIIKSPDEQVLKLLEDYSGTDFTNYKSSTISRRMERRLMQMGLNTMSQYLNYVEKNPDELSVLHKSFLIGVTTFFRDKDSFQFLHKKLATLIAGKKKNDSIRVWVPGCSTGEEAYSVGILLCEILGDKLKDYLVQIFASDIDEQALAVARKGLYSGESLKNVDNMLLQKYFVQTGDKYEVAKSVRALILFNQHDLTTSPAFVNLDLVSCRNLFIYFKHKLQEHIFPLFHYALREGGILFLGKSETIGPYKDLFSVVSTTHKLYFKNPVIHSRYYLKKNLHLKSKTGYSPPNVMEGSMEDLLRENFHLEYEHPFVVINEKMDVIHIQGDVSPFLALTQGEITLNVIKIAQKDIQIDLRALLTRCVSSGKAGNQLKRLTRKKKQLYVRFAVWPLLKKQRQRKLFVIAFENLNIELPLAASKPGKASKQAQTRIAELEQELNETKKHLQSFIEDLETSNEELQTLNEELQSTNEELQAANEELETSNEELQSTNEEMVIAYNELRELHRLLEEKQAQLHVTHNKLQTVFDNSRQCYMLVDESYTLQSFNSEANRISERLSRRPLLEGESVFNFIPVEFVGPFKDHVDQAFKGKVVTADQSCSIEGEMTWLHFQYVPVYGMKDRVESVLISYIDLTPEILAHKKLEASELLFRSLIENSRDVIIRQTADGKISYVSPSAERIMGYAHLDQVGRSITEFVFDDDRELLTDCLKVAAENPGSSINVYFRLKHRNGSLLWMEGTFANLFHLPEVQSLIINIRDVTDRETADRKIQESEVRFRSLIENSHEGIALINAHKKINYVTSSVNAILGFSNDELLGINVIDFIHPEDRADITALLQNLMSCFGQTVNTTYRMKNKMNNWRWIRSNITNMLHEPAVDAIVFNYEDITDRIVAETRLAAYNRNRDALINSTNDLMWSIGHDMLLNTANQAYIDFVKDTTGKELKQGDLILWEELETASADKWKQRYMRALSGETFTEEDYTAEPHELWREISFNPIWENNEVVGVACFSRNITDRKNSEVFALQNERMMADAQSVAHFGSWELDLGRNGQLSANKLRWSDEVFRIFGYEPGTTEVSNENFFRIIYPDDVTIVRDALEQSLKENSKYSIEHRIVWPDGSIRWVHENAGVISDIKTGRPVKMVGTVLDITEKKEAERKVKASEEFYRALVTNASDVVQLQGPDGIIRYESPGVKNILGYEPQEMIGRFIGEFIHPEDLPKANELVSKLIKENLTELFTQVRVLHKDGGYVWVEAKGTNMLGNPAINALVINYRDITDRKLAAEALQKSEANLRTIFDNTDIAYTLLDEGLNIVAFNPQANNFTELVYNKKLRQGENLLAFIHERELPSIKRVLEKVVRGENTRFERSYPLADDTRKWYQFRINRILSHENEMLGLCISSTDISVRKQAEFERERMTFDLVQRNKDLEQFAYIVSHNLRAPVANLLGITSVMNNNGLSIDEKIKLCTGMSISVQKLDTIINDLNFVLQTKRDISEKKERIKFTELLMDIRDNIIDLIIEEAAEIKNDFSQINQVHTLKSYLYSIFYNLITNSIKYRRPDIPPVIEIKSQRVANRVLLFFKDNGMGIDLETQGNYVFGLYKRFHLHKEGKGMGLFMVKSQVEALKGRITVKSKVGEGTEFHIELPHD